MKANERTTVPIVINQSSLKNFMNCQRLYAWGKIARLEPPGKRSALEIGTATHAGLAFFHAGGLRPEEVALEPFDPADPASVQAHARRAEIASLPLPMQALEVARAKLAESAGPRTAFEDKDLAECLDIVDRVLPAYVAHWAKTGELWRPLNQEIECLVEVGTDTNNWLRLRADNLSTAKGGLYLVDYKTAGRMDPRDLLKYELDVQLSAYIYGLSKFLTEQSLKEGGEPIYIRGAIIDVLVKTKIPQFTRELFTRTEEELQEFEAEFNEYCNRLREQLNRVVLGENWKIVFPKNTEHCFRYGTCAFRDLCLKDTEVRRKMYNVRKNDYVDDAQEQIERAQGLRVDAPASVEE